MTLRHLKVFITVCETGSVTRAAENLHIAQPAISQTISDVEKYYGVALFNRINQKLKLTEDGKLLFIKAKEVVLNFEEFENMAKSAAERPKINIGASLTFGKTVLPGIMRYVKDNMPEVRLFSVINNAREIQEGILDGNIDFAIIEGKPSFPNIKALEYSSDKLTVVCGYDYDYPNEVSIKELAKADLLLREKGSASRDYLESLFDINDLAFTPTMESISNQAIISAVRENLGVAVLPEDLIKSYLGKKRMKEVKIKDAELIRKSYVISHKNKTFLKSARKVYDYVCSGL